MVRNKILIGLGALALAAAPSVAQATIAPSIAPLSGDESELSESGRAILVVLGVVAVAGAIIAIADDDPQVPVSG